MSLEIPIENFEIYAHSLPIEWHLSNDQETHSDRMTRLAINLRRVITGGGVVDAAITNEKKILLGDKGLSMQCVLRKLNFVMFRAEKNRRLSAPEITADDISISGLEKFNASDINKLLNTNYNDEQIQSFRKIIYQRVVEIILHKMAEAK